MLQFTFLGLKGCRLETGQLNQRVLFRERS